MGCDEMARNSENIAGAISAVNAVISSQASALAELKALVQTKAAGSGGAALFGVICDDSTLYPISGVTASESDGVITIGG